MHNEIAIERYGYNNTNTVEEKTKELKRIGNDSLFYFGIFLTAFFLLHAIPFATGLFEQINIGINEVVVSAVGFANVFFLGVFNKIFKNNK